LLDLFRRPYLPDHDRVRKDAEVSQLTVESDKTLRRVDRILGQRFSDFIRRFR
jgi:hypothetical protein